jgi:hypothetical protein
MIVAELDARVAAAAAAIEAEAGGATVCTLHRDGRVTGGLKYHEGRLIAFREASRAVAAAATAAEARHHLGAIHSRWQEEFEHRRDAAAPSPPWVAYATGGLDAAGEALGLVE